MDHFIASFEEGKSTRRPFDSHLLHNTQADLSIDLSPTIFNIV